MSKKKKFTVDEGGFDWARDAAPVIQGEQDDAALGMAIVEPLRKLENEIQLLSSRRRVLMRKHRLLEGRAKPKKPAEEELQEIAQIEMRLLQLNKIKYEGYADPGTAYSDVNRESLFSIFDRTILNRKIIASATYTRGEIFDAVAYVKSLDARYTYAITNHIIETIFAFFINEGKLEQLSKARDNDIIYADFYKKLNIEGFLAEELAHRLTPADLIAMNKHFDTILGGRRSGKNSAVEYCEPLGSDFLSLENLNHICDFLPNHRSYAVFDELFGRINPVQKDFISEVLCLQQGARPGYFKQPGELGVTAGRPEQRVEQAIEAIKKSASKHQVSDWFAYGIAHHIFAVHVGIAVEADYATLKTSIKKLFHVYDTFNQQDLEAIQSQKSFIMFKTRMKLLTNGPTIEDITRMYIYFTHASIQTLLLNAGKNYLKAAYDVYTAPFIFQVLREDAVVAYGDTIYQETSFEDKHKANPLSNREVSEEYKKALLKKAGMRSNYRFRLLQLDSLLTSTEQQLNTIASAKSKLIPDLSNVYYFDAETGETKKEDKVNYLEQLRTQSWQQFRAYAEGHKKDVVRTGNVSPAKLLGVRPLVELPELGAQRPIDMEELCIITFVDFMTERLKANGAIPAKADGKALRLDQDFDMVALGAVFERLTQRDFIAFKEKMAANLEVVLSKQVQIPGLRQSIIQMFEEVSEGNVKLTTLPRWYPDFVKERIKDFFKSELFNDLKNNSKLERDTLSTIQTFATGKITEYLEGVENSIKDTPLTLLELHSSVHNDLNKALKEFFFGNNEKNTKEVLSEDSDKEAVMEVKNLKEFINKFVPILCKAIQPNPFEQDVMVAVHLIGGRIKNYRNQKSAEASTSGKPQGSKPSSSDESSEEVGIEVVSEKLKNQPLSDVLSYFARTVFGIRGQYGRVGLPVLRFISKEKLLSPQSHSFYDNVLHAQPQMIADLKTIVFDASKIQDFYDRRKASLLGWLIDYVYIGDHKNIADNKDNAESALITILDAVRKYAPTMLVDEEALKRLIRTIDPLKQFVELEYNPGDVAQHRQDQSGKEGRISNALFGLIGLPFDLSPEMDSDFNTIGYYALTRQLLAGYKVSISEWEQGHRFCFTGSIHLKHPTIPSEGHEVSFNEIPQGLIIWKQLDFISNKLLLAEQNADGFALTEEAKNSLIKERSDIVRDLYKNHYKEAWKILRAQKTLVRSKRERPKTMPPLVTSSDTGEVKPLFDVQRHGRWLENYCDSVLPHYLQHAQQQYLRGLMQAYPEMVDAQVNVDMAGIKLVYKQVSRLVIANYFNQLLDAVPTDEQAAYRWDVRLIEDQKLKHELSQSKKTASSIERIQEILSAGIWHILRLKPELINDPQAIYNILGHADVFEKFSLDFITDSSKKVHRSYVNKKIFGYEDKKKKQHVQGISEWSVRQLDEWKALGLFSSDQGGKLKRLATAATGGMKYHNNKESSQIKIVGNTGEQTQAQALLDLDPRGGYGLHCQELLKLHSLILAYQAYEDKPSYRDDGHFSAFIKVALEQQNYKGRLLGNSTSTQTQITFDDSGALKNASSSLTPRERQLFSSYAGFVESSRNVQTLTQLRERVELDIAILFNYECELLVPKEIERAAKIQKEVIERQSTQEQGKVSKKSEKQRSQTTFAAPPKPDPKPYHAPNRSSSSSASDSEDEVPLRKIKRTPSVDDSSSVQPQLPGAARGSDSARRSVAFAGSPKSGSSPNSGAGRGRGSLLQ